MNVSLLFECSPRKPRRFLSRFPVERRRDCIRVNMSSNARRRDSLRFFALADWLGVELAEPADRNEAFYAVRRRFASEVETE